MLQAMMKKELSLTYGELKPGQLSQIMESIDGYKTFVDFGSGNGRVCREACILKKFDEVIGLEILPNRIYKALKLKALSNDEMANCKFYLYDILRPFHLINGPAISFLCSTCFSSNLLKRLADIITMDKNIHAVISLKPVPFNANNWRVAQAGMINCSWDSSSYIIYKKI